MCLSVAESEDECLGPDAQGGMVQKSIDESAAILMLFTIVLRVPCLILLPVYGHLVDK